MFDYQHKTTPPIKVHDSLYVVPQERRRIVNPNEGKCSSTGTNNQSKPQWGGKGGTPKREYPGIKNPKEDSSWRQTELILRCQRENSNEDPSWRQKELITRRHQNQRGIPERESPGILIPKENPSWRQKEVNSKVPAGQFLFSAKFLRRSELAPKGINYEVLAGDFRVNRV